MKLLTVEGGGVLGKWKRQPKVLFPLTLTESDGEVTTYDDLGDLGDLGDLECDLECFDSEDRERVLTDGEGRRVKLLMVTMDVRVFELEGFPGSDPRERKVLKAASRSGSKLVRVILLAVAVFVAFFLNALYRSGLLPG
ncbi:MAG: hypothetical protein EOP88_08335 [Verrucomicrobiaceae bacterium]|nr:MAG: hypothetical protein EOP88_08335 [Verrucomicrobiaceae bacterium]